MQTMMKPDKDTFYKNKTDKKKLPHINIEELINDDTWDLFFKLISKVLSHLPESNISI